MFCEEYFLTNAEGGRIPIQTQPVELTDIYACTERVTETWHQENGCALNAALKSFQQLDETRCATEARHKLQDENLPLM